MHVRGRAAGGRRAAAWAVTLASGIACAAAAMGKMGVGGMQPPVGAAMSGDVAGLIREAATRLDAAAADASDTSALFGLPTAAQRQTARAAAKATLAAVDRAEAAAKAELAGLASATLPADRERAVDLRDNVLGAQVPLIRARADVILSAVTADRAEAARLASAAAGMIESIEGASTAAEGLRRVTLAAALMRRGGDASGGQGGPSASADAARARELVEAVVELPVGADPAVNVPARTRLEGLLARVRLAATGEQASAAASAAAPLAGDPLSSVLCAEAESAALLARALAAGAASPAADESAAIKAALEPMAALVARPNLGLTGDQLQALVWAKVAPALEPVSDGRRLPVLGRLARGMTLVHEPATRDAGLAILRDAAHEPTRDPADAKLAGEATWQLAGVLWAAAPADRVAAATAYTDLFVTWPAHARAEEAAHDAVAIVRDLLARAGDEPAVLRTAGRTLSAAIAFRPAGPEARACREALLAADIAQPTAERAALLGDFVAQLRLVALPPAKTAASGAEGTAPPPAELPEADAERLRALIDQAVRQHLAQGRVVVEADPAAKAAPWFDEVTALNQIIHDAPLLGANTPLGDELAVQLAEAAVLAKRADAAQRFTELLGRRPAVRVSGGAARLTLGLGRAQRQAGASEQAFTTLRAIVEPYENADPHSARPAEFWLAWTELLEIMAASNADGSRTGMIRLRLRELSAIDPRLGPPTAAARLRAVEAGLKGP